MGDGDGMRIVLLALIALIALTTAFAAPAMAGVVDSTGWCPTSMSPRKTVTSSVEIDEDLSGVRPMRKTFDSYQTGYDRDNRSSSMHRWRWPSLDGDKLQLSTYATSCHETGAGCYARYWEVPAKVVLVDPKPVTGCISYAFDLPDGMVVGFGGEVRTYLRRDTGPIVGPQVRMPVLEVLDVIDGAALGFERDGTLWRMTWQGTAAPALTKIGKLAGNVLSASRDNHGLVFVFTDAALYAFDGKTFAQRWRVDGEVWTVMPLDVPLTFYVLTIERGSGRGKVVLRMLDASGTEKKRRTVLDREVTEAHLERSGYYARPDLYQGVWVVHLAK
jgi:hypothetical protein